MSSWHPAPSPYSVENPDHRPSHQELGPQPPYPPQQPYPPPPSREGSGFPPDPPYSRQNSISGPSRSPPEHSRPHYPPPSSTPHEALYYPQSGLPDYHRPPNSNPYAAPESQPNGTHPPLHVQTGPDMMHGPPGGPPPSHPSYTQPPHSAGPQSASGSYPYFYDDRSQRRKPVRAAQACDSCRQRKAKCDEGRPECQHCKDNQLKCSYREIPPQKSEKQVLAITERLEGLSENVDKLVVNQKAQDDKIQQLLDLQTSLMPQMQAFAQSHSHRESGTFNSTTRPAPMHFKCEDSQVPQAQQNTTSNSFHSEKAEDNDEEGAQLEYSMPPKHTTAVHNLLQWPSIRALIPPKQSLTYVMDTESERGLIRLYGCGEGEDKGDGHEGALSPSGSSSSDGRRVDEETNSSSPHGVWGNGQLPSQPLSTDSYTAREHPGGLSPNGGLMLDSHTIDRYFQAYMSNMHILHPFLEPKVIRRMIHTFKRKYSWDVRPTRPMVGAKRKRELFDSPSSLDEVATTSQPTRSQSNHPPSNAFIEHSVANSIVLLVLALGKVCDHKEPLPGPATTTFMSTSAPHSQLRGHDLPPKTAVSTPNSPYGGQMELNGGTPRFAVSSPANPQGKNMDVIPGLAYFAKAADILGELPGGMDVSHIQANLLAGLYMGQLARPIPSHSYISVACRACQILIESTEYKEGAKDERKMSKSRRNLINFAFWSCLQLESDILAEVDLPPSGITRYEGVQHKEMPTGITLENIPESIGHADILRYYSYQVQLRRTMNDVHSMLYGTKKGQSKRPTNALLDILDDNLENWRKMLGDWDWYDDGFESSDINEARMRAKYYGAKYIIHRPSLQFLLRNSQPQTPSIKHSASPQGQSGSAFPSPIQLGYSPSARNRRQGEMGPPGRSLDQGIERVLIPYAQKCVEAAIRSTTAFDAVPRRLIITNIFGTGHAQFGNVLVLSATYTSSIPELSTMVKESILRRLLDRTINFLLEHREISPTLATDAQILIHVRSVVFP